MRSTLRIGTRGSPLALFQANAAAHGLQTLAGVACEIVTIKTSGDLQTDTPLGEAGGKRLFVKEIEEALLDGEVDLAVHSSKDMPTALPEGLAIAAVLPREDPRDALVLPSGHEAGQPVAAVREALGRAPRIGTSSVRRVAQLAGITAAARFLAIRGNLDTRLRKLDTGDYDALVLAAAGLRRLDREARITTLLPVDLCVPAPGQGIIAIEIRSRDQHLAEMLTAIGDAGAAVALRAERAVVERLGGGCQMPIGAYAEAADAGRLSLRTIVVSTDGSRAVRADMEGSAQTPEQLGREAADRLLAQGADAILAEVSRALPAHQPGDFAP